MIQKNKNKNNKSLKTKDKIKAAILLGLGMVLVFALSNKNYSPQLPRGSSIIGGEEYKNISFVILRSFEYLRPQAEEVKSGIFEDQVPAKVKVLNQQKVAIKGYMLPLQMNREKSLSFILLPNQMSCCFGTPPFDNEWIYVTMEDGRTTDVVKDVPVTIYGTLSVGEKIDRNGDVNLYRFTCRKVEFPKRSKFLGIF